MQADESPDRPSERTPPEIRAGFVLVAVALALFAFEAWSPRPQIDDAFITYRYARNLVAGHGLVFNVGEYIEGYTNLLWTLLVAAGLAVGIPAPSMGHFLGLASGLASLVATACYTATGLEDRGRWLVAVPLFVVVSSTGFAYWTMSGLETGLFLATVTAAFAAHARDRMGLATSFLCAATATRPDAGLAAVVIYGFCALPVLRQERWRSRTALWDFARWPLVYAGFLAALTLFRLVYYGDLLPNTFYAKVGGVPWYYGVIYVERFLFDGAVWLLVPACFVLISDVRFRPGCVYLVLVGAYVLRVGGDAFPYYRFLLPVLVMLAVFAVRGAEAAYRRSATLGVALATSIALAIASNIHDPLPLPIVLAMALVLAAHFIGARLGDPRILVWTAIAATIAAIVFTATDLDETKRMRALAMQDRNNRYSEAHALRRARAFEKIQPPPKLIATSSIGALGWYSDLPMLDLVGLVDEVIAKSEPDQVEGVFLLPGHQRSNANYVLSREPDFIVTPRPWTGLYIAAFAAIWKHPDVARDYEWVEELSAFRRLPPHPEQPASDQGAAPSVAPPSSPSRERRNSAIRAPANSLPSGFQ